MAVGNFWIFSKIVWMNVESGLRVSWRLFALDVDVPIPWLHLSHVVLASCSHSEDPSDVDGSGRRKRNYADGKIYDVNTKAALGNFWIGISFSFSHRLNYLKRNV